MLEFSLLKWFWLPAPLLLLVANAADLTVEAERPDGLLPQPKYLPRDEVLEQKKQEVEQKLFRQRPIGVRKMDSDEGAMFFPEYWQFDLDETDDPTYAQKKPQRRSLKQDKLGATTEEVWNNATLIYPLQAPLLAHSEAEITLSHTNRLLHHVARALIPSMQKRDFKCPGNTFSCTSIDRPNSCCYTGQSCELVADTGLGDVGCCSAGQTCPEELSGCRSEYTACSGGGCCIPGYDCLSVGCKTCVPWMIVYQANS